ncbi:hypothetical protein VM1G_08379 [Cytospora mali]|uniref:C2H2-type domain-containing protein n=1 Tax=Cytospora mali TaxID=578113 RepID=A0A194W991_CYTMA|nr:hypothetical protein VM1G_08379 [Valsa mali]
MAGAPHYNNNTYISVPTAYSEQAVFGANDLPDYGTYTGNLQRSLSRVSDETGSYGSPSYPISPGAFSDGYDYNLDSTQYNHRQAPPRSAASTRVSNPASWTDASIPRYDTFESQQMMVEQQNLQPSGIQSTRSPEYICLQPGCRQKPFRRSADLDRHIKHVHKKPNERYYCDYNRCQRSERVSVAAAASSSSTSPSPADSAVGTGPFGRKDHCRDHYRTFHKEDLCRRNGKEVPGWFDDRNISTSWWRCTKCLKRVSYHKYEWECNDCEQILEPERINARKRRMEMGGSSRGY